MGRRALRGSVIRTVSTGEACLLPDPELADGWILLVDDIQQSHVDLADPGNLMFEYMRRIGHLIDLMPPGPVRGLHLGGGAMTLARYTSATRPRSRHLVVETDADLVDLVREHLAWPKGFGIRVRIGDARTVLDGLPGASADLVILDVFASARTPGNLTTTQAFHAVAGVLTPSGTVVANIADVAPLAYARRYVSGMRAVFADVAVIAEPGVLRGRRFGNLVVAARPATADPLDVTALTRRCAADVWPARVLHAAELAAFVGDHRPYDDVTAPGSPEPPTGVFGPA